MRHKLLQKSALLISILFLGIAASCSAAKKPIKTLIITGQNNHNWKVSHLALQQILENSGLFEVDLAVTPPAGGDMSAFDPDFSGYQLVVLDYNGDRWSKKTDKGFLDFVNKGGGVIVYHAADNAFREWEEFSRICALGGWGGRDETDGPYVYWENGGIVRDNTPGSGGSHGPQHEFVMNGRDMKHPVTKGLPGKWLHAKDELYDKMRGPGNVRDVLFSAFSSKEQSGTGREELLIFTVDYGKSRIMHTMIGHAGPTLEDNVAMQCTGFQVTLLRGAEWAATGKVTQKVPADFPTADKVSLRKDYK